MSGFKFRVVEVLDTMLPYPVYTFRGFVAKICGIEIATEEKDKNHLFAISRS